MTNDIEALKAKIIDYPDFPKEGVMFKDINPLLRHHFQEVLDVLAAQLDSDEWENVDAIAGIDARGFILASALAVKLSKSFIPIRKSGKLPGKVLKKDYDLEYGQDALEMNYGQESIVIVDDVLATGGTLLAADSLAKDTGHQVQALLVLMNLSFLNKSEARLEQVNSVFEY